MFLAEDRRLGREVAVKMLRPQLGADPTVRYRFEQEARTAARLSHPNIVGIIDTGEDDGIAYIIMERLPGTTLADELEQGPLDEARVRAVAHQVLSALEAAHSAGIVHRDIKPANVLTGRDGRVKVADFGIAIAMDEAQAITSTGLLIGTPAYVAPERLAGAAATPSSDLYSLASVLYQCLTGHRAFEGASTIELITAVRDREPTPISAFRPEADPLLVEVVERALSKDPSRRPASASVMSRMLDGTCGTSGIDTMEIPGSAPERTRVMPLPAEPAPPSAFARIASGRWGALREVVQRYPAMLAFLGAALLALVIALPLAASTSTTTPSGRTGTASHVTHHLPALPGVPSPLARALDKLEQAVR